MIALTPYLLPQAPRVVRFDAAAPGIPLDRSFEYCVGSDRAAIYLRKEHQRDLALVRKELGFRYTRCHGIFNEEMGVVRKDGTYDWTKVDAYLDCLKKIGMKPFIETGFMPVPLASGKDTIFYYNGNTTPPKSYEAWAALIGAFTNHITQRYGRKEVRTWPFEIWNEPNLDGFWHGTQAEYFHLYEVSAKAIKAVDPAYQVGGPASAGGGWVPELIAFCESKNVPLDFVSTHAYGVRQGFLDENGQQGQVLDEDPQAVVGSIHANLEQIRTSHRPNLPLFITEWGPSYSSRDPIHDSYHCAAYILEKLAQTKPYAKAMSYWTFSDQFEESGPPPSPFHGGFGLLNAQGLKKPAFFTYRFLHQLGDVQVPTSDGRTIVTRAGRSVRILAWDFTTPKLETSNQIYFKRDLPASSVPALRYEANGLKPGRYTLSITRVGYRANDVYTAFRDLGSPKGIAASPALLPETALRTLRDATKGTPEKTVDLQVGDDRKAAIEIPMRTNDVCFVELKPR